MIAEPPARDVVVLSPHLDDAALSCGGTLHQLAADGSSVLVVTAFAGDLDLERLSPIGAEILRYMGLAADTAMARRREEDDRACAVLGAVGEHWPFRESVFRVGASGPHYPSRDSIFGKPSESDAERLIPELVERLQRLPRGREILVPLGVGNHVDHQLLRRAAETAFVGREQGEELLYYEDYPYVRRRFSLRRALGDRRRWRAQPRALSARDLEAKIEAIECYRSQVEPLFRSRQRMRRVVRRDARRRRGERFWSRSP